MVHKDLDLPLSLSDGEMEEVSDSMSETLDNF